MNEELRKSLAGVEAIAKGAPLGNRNAAKDYSSIPDHLKPEWGNVKDHLGYKVEINPRVGKGKGYIIDNLPSGNILVGKKIDDTKGEIYHPSDLKLDTSDSFYQKQITRNNEDGKVTHGFRGLGERFSESKQKWRKW